MSESTLPQLRSLTFSAAGRALRLRVLLPPNLAAVLKRGGNAAVKIEAEVGGAAGSGALLPSVPGAATGGTSASDSAGGELSAVGSAVVGTSASGAAGSVSPAPGAAPAVQILPPERIGKGPWQPEPSTFLVALLIESWCDGKIPSVLQLDGGQLRQLLQPLENTPAVFWLKSPQQPIPWRNGALDGVHSLLAESVSGPSGSGFSASGSGASASSGLAHGGSDRDISARGVSGCSDSRTAPPAGTAGTAGTGSAPGTVSGTAPGRRQENHAAASASGNFFAPACEDIHATACDTSFDEQLAALPQMEPGLTPLEVDGSPNFLALRLPSRESALYRPALDLVKEWGFKLEPSNGKWWLRDRHKTLQFLAEWQETLQTRYAARFSDNFTERTASLCFAQIDLHVQPAAPANGVRFDVELSLRARGLDEASLQQALEKGQFYAPAFADRGSRGNRNSGGSHMSHTGQTAPEGAVVLIGRSVRARLNAVQLGLGAAPSQGLRVRFRRRVSREEIAVTQNVLQLLVPQSLTASGSAQAFDTPTDCIALKNNAGNPAAVAKNASAASDSGASDDVMGTTATDAGPGGRQRAGRGTAPHDRRQQPGHVSQGRVAGASAGGRTRGPTASDTVSPQALLLQKLPSQWLALSRALNDLSGLEPCPAPSALSGLLRPYQQVGAAWLWHLYRNGLGGILADEMGLGKTIQCLTFLSAAHGVPGSRAASGVGDRGETHGVIGRHVKYGAPGRDEPDGSGDHGAPCGAGGSRCALFGVRNRGAEQRDDHSGSAPSVASASIVVCPASLVENWRREAAKFAPWLRVFCHHGAARLEAAGQAEHFDLILTSYGTLVRDQALFEQIPFRVAVADEAQHIKNAKTQSARALRALRTQGRFLLTGTPIENDLKELQSLFAFILPGYLDKPGSGMAQRLGAASLQDTAAAAAMERERLITRAAPYLLRRMKQAVAKDLPDKIEQVVYCELEPPQRSFYRAVQETARRAVLELEMGNAPEGRVRMAAFTELLRLRQACIDPRLVDPQETIGSAKRAALQELVEDAVGAGHRMLVFSQFTSALRLVAEDLEQQGIAYFYLDGQTPNRTELCERFNADASVKVFLISLRAGGTGLNLTGADTVVHLDPWWNPAAQAQATDRAHRIGQKRVVNVYQLIAADTVEEKVLTLQREKAALLEQLLDASDAVSAKVGLGDLKELIG